MKAILTLLTTVYISIFVFGSTCYSDSKVDTVDKSKIQEKTILGNQEREQELTDEEWLRQFDEKTRNAREEATSNITSEEINKLTSEELQTRGVGKSLADKLTKNNSDNTDIMEYIIIEILSDKRAPKEVKYNMKQELEKLPLEQRIGIQNEINKRVSSSRFDNPSYTGFIYLGALILLIVYYVNRYSKRRVG